MVAKKAAGPPPYGFNPDFERAIAVLLAHRPKFYGLVGRDLDYERFTVPAVRLVVKLVKAMGAESGHGPSAFVLVVQRATRAMEEGTVTREEVDDIIDLFDEFGSNLPNEPEVVAELVPVLKRELEAVAVRSAIDVYGRKGSFDEVAATLRRSETLGKVDRSTGSKLSVAALGDIRRLRQGDRLQTGILELDFNLGGGLPRGKAGMIVAGAKVGKSFFLTGQAAHALAQGHFVALATLELSEEDQNARLISNLTGVPIDAVVDGSQEERITELLEELLPTLGVFRVKFFPAGLTTMVDIVEWVKEIEEEEKRKVDLLEIDYIDKVGSSNKKHSSTYDIQGQAAEDFRLHIVSRQCWGWTASQPKRRDAKERGRRIEIDDIADSQNKVRVMDLILTAHRPCEEEVEFYVAGNRNGRDKFSVGPFPHALAIAQLVPSGSMPSSREE